MKKRFKWTWIEFLCTTIGIFLYSLSIKIFINPNNLYNGGIMGVSQLIRTFIVNVFNLKLNFDLASVIYYIINIPLFYLAYKKVGKTFLYRTIYCVTICTIFLFLIPSIAKPIVDDVLTNVIIGGVICGFGTGLVISVGASTGGTDIIGMIVTKKFKKISVGSFNLSFNVMVYGFCAIAGGIPTLIYSVLYSVFDSTIFDKLHFKNINSEVLIFTKKNPKLINNYIKEKLGRDFTYWEAKGGYKDTKTYITYTVLSKYEKLELEYALKEFDNSAFVVDTDGVSVKGNFDKKLQD